MFCNSPGFCSSLDLQQPYSSLREPQQFGEILLLKSVLLKLGSSVYLAMTHKGLLYKYKAALLFT